MKKYKRTTPNKRNNPAYLDNMANPEKRPAKIQKTKKFEFIPYKIKSKLIDQKKINGVSVEIKNDPTPVIGRVNHINKTIKELSIFSEHISLNKKNNINALKKLIIGAKILIAATESPNKKVLIEINQAIIGGLEK